MKWLDKLMKDIGYKPGAMPTAVASACSTAQQPSIHDEPLTRQQEYAIWRIRRAKAVAADIGTFVTSNVLSFN